MIDPLVVKHSLLRGSPFRWRRTDPKTLTKKTVPLPLPKWLKKSSRASICLNKLRAICGLPALMAPLTLITSCSMRRRVLGLGNQEDSSRGPENEPMDAMSLLCGSPPPKKGMYIHIDMYIYIYIHTYLNMAVVLFVSQGTVDLGNHKRWLRGSGLAENKVTTPANELGSVNSKQTQRNTTRKPTICAVSKRKGMTRILKFCFVHCQP